MSLRVQLAPDVPDLAALGATGPEDFLERGAGLVTGARSEPVEASRAGSVYRVPLPGTPDASGRRAELPRGIGTGWLRVHVFESGALQLARERLAAPRSTSPAARRWNLACHLLAHGVGAPRPLALIERPRGLGCTSALVEQELTGLVPLPDWLAAQAPGPARARGLRALGLTLAALARSDAWFPELAPSAIRVAEPEAGEEGCAAEQIERLREEGARWRERGLTRARLPGFALDDLAGGRLDASLDAARRLAWLARLEGGLGERATLAPRERLRLALALTAGAPDARASLRASCAT